MKPMKAWNEMLLSALFAFYMYVLFKVILFKFSSIDLPFLWRQLQRNIENPEHIQNRLSFANFKPFLTISNNIHSLSQHDLVNLFGNIAVFMPYGMFLILMSRQKKMSLFGALIRSVGLSLCLESLQLVLSMGSFDVDDLILNGLGGIIGYSVFRLSMKCKTSILRMIESQHMTLSKEGNIT
ncbi:VanZ family protein [Paenibacillus qinlingensis]|uniref:VanZ family protein n=1 Tax=Paenibacillus qinlingensis TaxID=1837343 RepID=UPI001FED2370|nr:VanZ family protein [Paenibacillus qinlingensis]